MLFGLFIPCNVYLFFSCMSVAVCSCSEPVKGRGWLTSRNNSDVNLPPGQTDCGAEACHAAS